jgi:hypothetical protein
MPRFGAVFLLSAGAILGVVAGAELLTNRTGSTQDFEVWLDLVISVLCLAGGLFLVLKRPG